MPEFYGGKRVAVTGAAGFIGSHLVDKLVGVGAHVVALDNLHSGVMTNLAQSIHRIRFHKVDVRDRAAVCTVLDGSDIVFHLAGNALVPYSVENPAYDFESNVLGTYHVLELLRQERIGRVVFSSSAAVYGVPMENPVSELYPLEPISPYGASKLAAERLGVGWARTYDVHFVVARIYNTYGPRQRKYVMYDLLNKLHRNPHHLEVLGDGTQMRDYSYVSDTVRALLLLGERGLAGEAYNVAGDNPTRISALIDLLLEVMGLEKVALTYTGESWRGDVPTMVADMTKLKSLGFEPQVSLPDGLASLLAWMDNEVWDRSTASGMDAE